MIDRVVAISCEHQMYRRAAQLTSLQLADCPLDKYHIIWGHHRNEYTDVALVEMLVSHGLENFSKVLDLPESHDMRQYTLSEFEAHIRMLKYCVETEERILKLDDDILLKRPFHQLENDMARLAECADHAVGAVQLFYDPYGVGKYPMQHLKIVQKYPEYGQGSISSGNAILYLTPLGASHLLDFFKATDRITNLEGALPNDLHNAPWLFSAMWPHGFELTALQGDSITMYHTIKEDLKTRDDNLELPNHLMAPIEKYKLGGRNDGDVE